MRVCFGRVAKHINAMRCDFAVQLENTFYLFFDLILQTANLQFTKSLFDNRMK